MISAFVPPPSLHSICIWTLLPLWAMHTDAYNYIYMCVTLDLSCIGPWTLDSRVSWGFNLQFNVRLLSYL